MEIRRGDLVTAVAPGDYGKPRPALVVQSDFFGELLSLTVLPLTSDMRSAPLARISIDPTRENGLERRSHIMIDKAATVSRTRIRQRIGSIDDAAMRQVDQALAKFLALE
jgi:mRNA interferase MazF